MRTIIARGLLPGLIACTLQAGPAKAAVVPRASSLQEKAFRHPDLTLRELQQRPHDLGPGVAEGLEGELAAMGVALDSGFYDSRAGRWSSLVLSEPLVPGTGVGNHLRWSDGPAPGNESALREQVWSALVAYLRRFQDQLKVDLTELEATPQIGIHETGTLIHVRARRVVGGVPVRRSGLSATLNHGNLVLLGLQNWGDIGVVHAPGISKAAARAVLMEHARPFTVAGFVKEPYLELIPMAGGTGYLYRLAWVVKATMDGDLGTWEALVDAKDGELIAFEDTNQYASRKVVGGVYPASNDQRPPDGIEQTAWPMPYADVIAGGSAVSTNSGGVLGCAAGNISTSLSGRYVRANDFCGVTNEASPGDLDLGFGPSPESTDCTVPPGHSAGDTKSSRSGFYEMNRIIEQARTFLPDNVWLQSQLTANMNRNQTCNAYWNGGTVNFFRDNGSACRNTGEIAGIFDHEWGHGMDNNGVNTDLSQPGEAIADIYAILRLNTSCVGRGFFKNQVCGGYGDPCDGTPSTGCTGVRDLDFMNHRCNQPHTITWATSGFTSAQCGGTGGATACPVSVGTPCGRETHCEGMVAAETVWDLQFRDLRRAPFNFDENTALELATRLAFLGSQAITDWYTCSVGGGCGATSGYMLFLAADDDNGNLVDGTPHMTAIRAAFERHEIHCPTPPDADSGCAGGPNTAPTLTAVPVDQGATLSWNPVAGAVRYYVYRTEGVAGCSFGKVKVGETTGTTFADQGLMNGRAYDYAAWPVGANPSCFGLMSACASVTPTAGANVRILDAFQVTPTGGDGDSLLDNCETATVTFAVENTGTGALTNVRLVSVTPLTHPATVVTTTLPAPISPSLADCATANGSFGFRPQGLSFGQTTQLRIEVTADELGGQTRSQVVSISHVESDTQPVASRTYGFDADREGWTTTLGTFQRATPGAQGTTHHVSSSELLPFQCDVVRSPVIKLHAGSTLSLYNRYEIEPSTPTGIPYDRANVGLVDVQNGTRTVVSPNGGQLYTLASGAVNGTCGATDQAGWHTTSPGYPSFNQSTWSASAFNPGGIFTDRLAYLEIRYGTDPGIHLAGFDFDQVTITDFDDLVPDLQADSCSSVVLYFATPGSSVPEDGGPTVIEVAATTSNGQPTTAMTSVQFATADGTAVAGSDYAATSGTLVWPSGSPSGTTRSFDVTIHDDALDEDPERFTATLSNPVAAGLGASTHTVTIADDDPLPALAIGDLTVTEGNSGATPAIFTLSLAPASGRTVTVHYGAAAGTATAGVDFGTAASTVVFPAGTTVKPAPVPVFGDWIAEANETFSVNLSGAAGATVADSQGQGTITDDDTPGLSIDDVAVRERVGAAATVTFTVTNAPPSGGLVSVDWATADGTATAGSDYQPASGRLFFDFGMSTLPITVTVNADGLVEGMETFAVSLSGASGSTIARGTGTARVLDPPAGGDFNADTRTDLAWRHDTSGEIVLWFMDGATLLGGTFTTPPALSDAGWRIVGTNDFNADAKPDLLWRHAVSGDNVLWYMNGWVLQSGTFLTPTALADVSWRISGTGDFNLDGKPDILWRHAASGESVVWYMNGSVLQSGTFLTPSGLLDANWQIAGTGDFDLDGKTDILWRHAVSGENAVWRMEGSSLRSGTFLTPPALADFNWRIVATGDYDRDGKVDIAWRHAVSGQNVIWFMDGTSLASGSFTTTLADMNWRIVGPR